MMQTDRKDRYKLLMNGKVQQPGQELKPELFLEWNFKDDSRQANDLQWGSEKQNTQIVSFISLIRIDGNHKIIPSNNFSNDIVLCSWKRNCTQGLSIYSEQVPHRDSISALKVSIRGGKSWSESGGDRVFPFIIIMIIINYPSGY